MGVGSIELLHALSYRADKLLRKRGELGGILWVTETTAREREFFETVCDNAPAEATELTALGELRRQMAEDFAAAGVTVFACAYTAVRVMRRRSVTAAPFVPPLAELHTDIVVIEAHDIDGEHWRAERELIELKPGRPILGAMGPIEMVPDSIYADILGSAVRLQAAS